MAGLILGLRHVYQVANELKALLAKEEGYGFKQVVLAVLDQPTCDTFA